MTAHLYQLTVQDLSFPQMGFVVCEARRAGCETSPQPGRVTVRGTAAQINDFKTYLRLSLVLGAEPAEA